MKKSGASKDEWSFLEEKFTDGFGAIKSKKSHYEISKNQSLTSHSIDFTVMPKKAGRNF